MVLYLFLDDVMIIVIIDFFIFWSFIKISVFNRLFVNDGSII